ncbi:hypothetical protein Tco_0518617, partial [Tanacetum coccineum]
SLSYKRLNRSKTLDLQNPFYLKQAQQKQQSLYNGKVLLEKHDPPPVYDSEDVGIKRILEVTTAQVNVTAVKKIL